MNNEHRQYCIFVEKVFYQFHLITKKTRMKGRLFYVKFFNILELEILMETLFYSCTLAQRFAHL